jgi:type II secretory pathway component GspD/PulD (secretin)
MLKITPWVGASGEITADIEPEVSSVSAITAEGLPEINRRKARTTIRIRDGDTIVIGGLKQQDNTKSVTKIPLLGDLPILGALFRSTKSITRESELLILITPRILRQGQPTAESDTKETVNDAENGATKTEAAALRPSRSATDN